MWPAIQTVSGPLPYLSFFAHRELNKCVGGPWVALDKTGVPAHGHSGAVKAALIADHIVLRYNVRVTGGYEVI